MLRALLVVAVTSCALEGRGLARAGEERRNAAEESPLARIPLQPLRFEEAPRGDELIATARGRGYSLDVGADAATVSLGDRELRVELVGASRRKATYEEPLFGVTNYLIGNDPSKWRIGVPGYRRVRYSGVYPGIDLLYYGAEGNFEYDFVVAPGADPSQIGVRFTGADDVRLDPTGDIVVDAGGREVRHKHPLIYQNALSGARQTIAGHWVLEGLRARFELGEYDRSRPLVIDPVLTFATYLGIPGQETPAGVALGPDGSIYVLAASEATESVPEAPSDLFVTKLSPDGSRMEYRSVIGGAWIETAGTIRVDGSGNAFIMASTQSSDFPLVPGGYGAGCAVGCAGIPYGIVVLKLSSSGSLLIYTAFIRNLSVWHRGAEFEGPLAIDSQGNAFVAGSAVAGDALPLLNAAQPSFGGSTDAYVFKLNASGTNVDFATWLGGSSSEVPAAIGVDVNGNAYVVGSTESSDFPTVDALQPWAGLRDVFITKYRPSGQVLFSTLFGGNGWDQPHGVAVWPDGAFVIVGQTSSTNFPVLNALQPTRATGTNGAGTLDAFVTRFTVDMDMDFSTYLGTPRDNGSLSAVAIDDAGNSYLVTDAPEAGFPLLRPIQAYQGSNDMYFAKLDVVGHLLRGTYLGGAFSDSPIDIAVDRTGHAVVVGAANSTDMPVLNALQPTKFGSPSEGSDTYVARLSTTITLNAISPNSIPPNAATRVTLTGTGFFGSMSVFIGGQAATDVVVNSFTSMTVSAPALAAGTYDVAIVSPYGDFAQVPDGLLYGTCQSSANMTTVRLLGSGGTRPVLAQSNAPFCPWTAQSQATWISVGPSAGMGTALVDLMVAPNPNPIARRGTVTIAGTMVTVEQGPLELADLNQDAHLDLVWRHETSGDIAAWFMNGTMLRSGVPFTPGRVLDPSWKIVGLGDLDGDGGTDLVWQNIADGRLAAWLMNGVTLRSGVPLSPAVVADVNWRIRSVGDVDGDGKPDLIWQHVGDGRIAVWFMDGLRQRSGELFSPSMAVEPGWQIAGSADFDMDGRRDLLWQHLDGRISVWLMDGTRMIDVNFTTPPGVGDTQWKICAVGDVDRDGKPDLIWQHQTTGHLAAWIMNGLTLMSGRALTPAQVTDTNWRIAGPR